MSSITLLTDGSKYSSLIRNKKVRGDDTFIILTDPGEKEKTSGADENAVEWNKRSSLSARNAILTVLNRYGSIDEAVLVYQPGNFNKTFHETSAAVYDLQVDRWIKGYGYLLKELIQLFIKQQHGQISFILDTDGIKVQTPLEAAIFSYLKSMIQNLGILYQNEGFRIFCFESETARKEEFLDFYYKTILDSRYTAGKIYRFSDKKGLFDFSRN